MENEELEVVENNNEEQLSEEELEELEHVDIDTDKFTGYFHERDSLSENNIVNEVKTSFLEYSMSVITSRALPDLRDGLKPVHRRILWSMYESGYTPIYLLMDMVILVISRVMAQQRCVILNLVYLNYL